nr:MAG TPA: hypothetical protein [Caudoviricetes sp.]
MSKDKLPESTENVQDAEKADLTKNRLFSP